jgi:DNA mismatch repair protein MutL|tara:strand:+ start:1222 stop:2925 length:1704 start_codon:yes stop_codon:yes gene_type:complete
MPKITILDDALINKIAAGEVVERPASVVKELIENSIDANADEIVIDIKDGGKSLIKVADNGNGMDKDDAKLCIERHATSKLSNVNELSSISTLGFRGEALSSIASVSDFSLITKTEQVIEGTIIRVEEGKTEIKDIGCSKGTVVEVKSLFSNIPARKKFLKSIQVEFNYIANIVTRYALINKDIFFKLVHNDKIIFSSQKTDSLFNNIVSIYGKEIASNLVKVFYESDYLKVYGYIGKPALTRNDKQMQSCYVNKRYVKNNIISNALYDAFHTLLFINRHPITVLNIEINPETIDVNVHPSKKIIKVFDEDRFYNDVFNAVRQSLYTNNLIPDAKLDDTNYKDNRKYPLQTDKQSVLAVEDSPVKKKQTEEKTSEKIGPFLLIGQISKTYILAENNKGLLIIDQHAAQERINYEKFMKQYEKEGIKTQKLVKPKVINLSAAESGVMEENINLLSKLGFGIDNYGNNSFILRTTPSIFGRVDTVLITDILTELSGISSKSIAKAKEERIIRFACRKSIKAGEEMTMPLMEKLIEELDNTEQPFTCPHGRPTAISISLPELERKFKRVV